MRNLFRMFIESMFDVDDDNDLKPRHVPKLKREHEEPAEDQETRETYSTRSWPRCVPSGEDVAGRRL